jgi:hypothetical protein
VTQEPGSTSAAATAADKVRMIIEAADRAAAELEAGAREEAARIREQAERETEAQLRRAEALADSLPARAAELERALADAGERVRGAIEALRDELSELRAGVVGDLGRPPSEPAPGASADASTEVAPGSPGNGTPVGAMDASEAKDPSEANDASEAEDAAGATPAGAQGEPPPRAPDPGAEGARVIALNMALNGSSREETARYLSENFELEDREALLDDVYERAGA